MDPRRQNFTSEEEVFHLSIVISQQAICECCPWVTVLLLASAAYVDFFPDFSQGISLLTS